MLALFFYLGAIGVQHFSYLVGRGCTPLSDRKLDKEFSAELLLDLMNDFRGNILTEIKLVFEISYCDETIKNKLA